MLRGRILIPLLLILAIWPGSGSASTGGTIFAHRVALRASMPPHDPRAVGHRRMVREIIAHRPSLLTPNGLRVAPSYFSPATLNPSYDYVEDNSTANQNSFAPDHSTTYENLGRITGYYERADWITSNGRQVIFRYQGSVMRDDAAALAAQQDGVSHEQTAFSGKVSDCPNATPPPSTFPNCSYVVTQDVQKTTWFTDYMWAVGSCLVETEAQLPQTLDSATVNQVESTLSNFTFQARQQAVQLCGSHGPTSPTPTRTVPAAPTPTSTLPATPTSTVVLASATPTSTSTRLDATATPTRTATPTPTSTTLTSKVDVTLITVRAEKNGAKEDLTSAPLILAKVGQKFMLSIYVEIMDGTAGTAISFDFNAKEGGVMVVSKTTQDAVPAKLPAQIRKTVIVTATKNGKLTFTGSVTSGGKSQHQSTKISIAGSTKRECTTIAGVRYCTNP